MLCAQDADKDLIRVCLFADKEDCSQTAFNCGLLKCGLLKGGLIYILDKCLQNWPFLPFLTF